MKTNFTLLVTLLVITVGFSQSKVGTVNTDVIIGKMPQMKMVINRITNYGKKLDSSFQVKVKDYTVKVEEYKKVMENLSEEDKKTKVQELSELNKEMGAFRENSVKLIQLRRDEFMRPLYKKMQEVITEIAKAKGFTQILTTNGNEFMYIDENLDITKEVLSKLGISE